MNIDRKIKEQKASIDTLIYLTRELLNTAVIADVNDAFLGNNFREKCNIFLDGRFDAYKDPNINFDTMKDNELINYAFKHHDWIVNSVINSFHNLNVDVDNFEVYQPIFDLPNIYRKELAKLSKLRKIKNKFHIK